MKKVLVLGSTGMLGHQVVLKLKERNDFEVFDLSFRTKFREETIICDVTDFQRLEQLIYEIQPNIIINCIGVLIKGSNENPKNSILLNSYLPHHLVFIANGIGAMVIHISTDCVFSGKKGEYLEFDFRDADDVYGRSKALGEIFSEKHLTLRTSIIGPELKSNGEGLFEWVLKQKKSIFGYTNVFWSGLTTIELSNVILYCLDLNKTGIINVTNGYKISKFEVLSMINNFLDLRLKIIPNGDKKSDKSMKSIYNDFGYSYTGYEGMIRAMCNDYLKSSLYDH